MTWITATDPLALVAIQAGKVSTPAKEEGADGGGRLDAQQRAVELGEPVPIVFARRRNNKGGIFISPGATEARFENNATNEVRAYYHLVISEGKVDSIPVKDVFQRACRVGTHTQTYDRRAGTWTPENDIVQRSGYTLPEAPAFCGTVGAYPDMSTLSFRSGYIPDGFDQWNRQVHLFIRGGMWVTRLEDDVLGPSDSYADLVYWLMTKTSRVPSDLIDVSALEDADLFLRVNGFTCNCWLTESRNLVDLLAEWSPYFLLGQSNKDGKKGLRPVLPVTTAGAIDTGTITPAYAFTEASVLPESFEIGFTSLADRQPFVAQMIWRQQLQDDFGIIRTAEVRIAGTAEAGPYESHDLSAFCTDETHAVRVGAYIVAKRIYTTHTIRFAAKPGLHSTTLTPGDIIRVRLARRTNISQLGYHDYLYQIERITKTLSGDVSYECTHFPVDSEGRSLVALSVMQAVGSGITLTSTKSGVTCDTNGSSDDTVPSEEFTEVDWTTDENPFGQPVDDVDIDGNPSDTQMIGLNEGILADGSLESGFSGAGSGSGSGINGDSIPSKTKRRPDNDDNDGGGGGAEVGDELQPNAEQPDDGCRVLIAWYSVNPTTGATVIRKTAEITSTGDINNATYELQPEDEGAQVYTTSVKVCSGDSEPETETTDYGVVKPKNPSKVYKYFRFTGTEKLRNGSSGAIGSGWYLTDWYVGGISKKSSFTEWGTSAEAKVSDFVTPPGCANTYDPTPAIRTKNLGFTVFVVSGSRSSGCVGGTYGSNDFLKSISGKWEFSDDKVNVGATIG